MVETTWAPWKENIILRGVLKREVSERKVKSTDNDGNYYIDDYDWFVYDKGNEVDPFLEIGDEVEVNHANIRVLNGVTNRKKEETLALLASDLLIRCRRPGPVTI